MRSSDFLFVILLICNASNAFYRMYETSGNINHTIGHAFHCLHYLYIDVWTKTVYEWNRLGDTEIKHYCRRLKTRNNNHVTFSDTKVVNGQEFAFDRLRQMNILPQQLFDWYAPMDTIEEYILGQNKGSFYNCSRSKSNYWFGPRCQYTFDSKKSFLDIIENQFNDKAFNEDDILSFTTGTCYPMNEYDCQSVLCLDWREICDGKIDCANGVDEHRCDELEMNECDQTTEYRCLNGQCIDKVFYWDERAECMDNSDERYIFEAKNCYYLFNARCEDRLCPSMWFSCGDGHCYDGPNVANGQACSSKRDRLYFEQMPPSTLILFSHVSLIYNDTQPERICYNETLCPYISKNRHSLATTFALTGATCLAFNTFTNETYSNMYDMMKDFKTFVRSCSIPPHIDSYDNCSLFQCADSSKCVSFHRLSDGYEDCVNGEDEHQTMACSLDHPHRYTCDMGTRCIHRSLLYDGIVHCADESDEYATYFWLCSNGDNCPIRQPEPFFSKITFGQVCNNVVERVFDSTNTTDETDCSMNEWDCLTHYSKCNDIWNCPDGHDELGCNHHSPGTQRCSNQTHFCLNMTTGLATCLSVPQAGDGIVDCVGSSDERAFCRIKYPNDIMRRYRCRNSDQCISPFQVCNCYQDCPENDDETSACVWLNNGQAPFCHPFSFRCRDGEILHCQGTPCRCNIIFGSCKEYEQNLFCELIDYTYSPSLILNDLEEYPSARKNQMSRSASLPDGFRVWYCNRGLFVRSTDNSAGFYCFCPEYYYGDRCQYQRKRVSVTLEFKMRASFGQSLSMFKIVVLLVSQNSNSTTLILSHNQFLYMPQQACLQKHLIQLLYPINDSYSSSFTHSVYIYAFNAQPLKHRASWKFPVPFDFLPVNRIAKQLYMSDTVNAVEPLLTPIFNTNCTFCSSISLCLGYDLDLNRDICLCPLNHTGRRCLISFNPCTKDSCNEHGQCVPVDERFDEQKQWMCLCDIEWIGDRCQYPRPRIHVSFAGGVRVPASNIVISHTIYAKDNFNHLTNFHRTRQEMSNFTIYLNSDAFFFDLVFIHLYEHRDQFDYYLLLARKYTDTDLQPVIRLEIHPSGRCRPIHELFDTTIINQSPWDRVKSYQRPCRQPSSVEKLRCFYDDKVMCLCDENNYTNCFNFNSTSFECPWTNCSYRGICVQNHEICPTMSVCVCEPCSYGSICQFTTAGYSISLDAILGSHIFKIGTTISQQTRVIQISVIIHSILFAISIILGIFTIGTFCQKTTHDVGCGLFLLVSSCLGLVTMVMLMSKILMLIYVEQLSVSCALAEFLLKWLPTMSEWLNACVSIERTLIVIRQTSYSHSASRRRAKWIVASVFLFTALVCSPELIFRRPITDTQDGRTWCVLTLNPDRRVLQTLYSISNVLLFSVPITINLSSSIIILINTIRVKQKLAASVNIERNKVKIEGNTNYTDKTKAKTMSNNRLNIIKEQIRKHKHLLIGSLALGILALPRLILTFIFVCTKLDRKPFLSLFAYLTGFLPSMAVFPVFVLPSKTYRAALVSFVDQSTPQIWSMNICRRRRRM